MEINYILIGVGLIVCLGGIYLKNLCTGLMGLIWGLIGSFIVAMLSVGMWKLLERDTVITVLLCAVVIGLLSAALYKISMAINGFLSSFSIVLLVLPSLIKGNSIWITIGIAVIIGIFIAIVSYKYCDYSIVIMTAFSGAFVASVGAIGVYKHYSISEQISTVLFFNMEKMAPVLVGTIVLGFVGIGVQFQRLKHRNGEATETKAGYQEIIQSTDEQNEEMVVCIANDNENTSEVYDKKTDGEETVICEKCGTKLNNIDL